MLICNQEFAFSPLNADDIERMEQAQKKLRRASAQEAERVQQEHCGYAEQLRGQCRLIMDFLDETLGAGASVRLGLTGNDLGQCSDVVEQIKAAISAEKTAFSGASDTENAAPVRLAVAAKTEIRPRPEKAVQSAVSARVERLLADPEARALLVQLLDKAEAAHNV